MERGKTLSELPRVEKKETEIKQMCRLHRREVAEACAQTWERYTEREQRPFCDITKGQSPYTCVLAEESVAGVNKGLLDPSNSDRLLSNVNFGIRLLHFYPASVIGLSNEPLK